jgi:tetratricopeptide (TPR) repeat protein
MSIGVFPRTGSKEAMAVSFELNEQFPLVFRRALGQYELLEEINRNAVGSAYNAKSTVDGGLAVVHALPLSIFQGGETESGTAEMFCRELERIKRFQNPCVSEILDMGVDVEKGVFFLVVEQAWGTTIEELVEQQWLLPPTEIFSIIRSLSRALDGAVESGIGRICLHPVGIVYGGSAVKLVDFALNAALLGSVRRGGVLKPFLRFAAPEILAGSEGDGRSAVYTLGIQLLELFAGEHSPYADGEGISWDELWESGRHPSGASAVPDFVRSILRRALEKEPGKRFKSCRELSKELEDSLYSNDLHIGPADTKVVTGAPAGGREDSGHLEPEEDASLGLKGGYPRDEINDTATDLEGLDEFLRSQPEEGKTLEPAGTESEPVPEYVEIRPVEYVKKEADREYQPDSMEMIQSCEARNQQGMQLYLNGHIEDALFCWKASAEAAPQVGETHYFLAHAYFRKKEYATAKTHLRKAVEIEPQRIEYKYFLGEIYRHLGNLHAAMNWWYTVVKEAGTFAPAHISLGLAFSRQGNVQLAIRFLRQGLEYDPANIEGNIGLGNLFYGMKDMQRAARHWRRVVRQEPANTRVKKNLGLAFFKQGKYGLSISYLKEVVRADTADATTYRNLARAYYRCGDFESALREYEKSLECDKESPPALMARLECMRLRDLIEKWKARHGQSDGTESILQ